MRVVIAQEGVEEIPGQVLEPDSIKWVEGKVYPMTWGAANWEKVIGTATDIRREDDGHLTAEITVTDDTVKQRLSEVGTTIFVNEVVDRKVGRILYVISANLKSLFMTVDVPWTNGQGVSNG